MKREIKFRGKEVLSMTHGSLFSGIGGFEEGAKRAGIKNVWACEIEEFQQKILKKNYESEVL